MIPGNKHLRSALLIALGCGLTPFAANATDFTPDTTPHISDPAFLPAQGQVLSTTTYSHTDRSTDFVAPNGFKLEHLDANAGTVSETLEYGITDRLSFEIEGAYTSAEQQYHSSTFLFGSRTDKRDDFENPSFALTYRVVDQTMAPVSVDLSVAYSPSAVADSEQTAGGGIAVSRQMKDFTIQARFGATYVDAYDGSNNGFNIDHDSYWTYEAQVRSQYRLTDRLAFDSGVSYSWSDDINYVGGEFTDSHDGTWQPFAALNYELVPNKINVAFEYDHAFDGVNHRTGSINADWRNSNENLYAVHLRILL